MPDDFERFLARLGRREWITHTASTDSYRGGAGRAQLVRYLAHYVRGVAMSNRRIFEPVTKPSGSAAFLGRWRRCAWA